jgi:putative hemolysin
MKDTLVSRSDFKGLHPIFQGKYGDKIIDFGMKVGGLRYANEVYNGSKHLTGPAFCKDALDKMGISRVLHNEEVLSQVEGGPFITVSNHPYGHVDGIAIIEAMGSRVPDYKMMVNFILGLIDTMAENFITVNPMKNEEKNKVTFAGIRESIAHLKAGHPMGFFPAGAVSNLYIKKGKPVIEDREWQPAVLKIIKKSKVPVIPIHVSGYNSLSFYLSRIFGWKARNLRLCHELNNKRGKEMILTFGEPILPRDLKRFGNDTRELGEFLKRTTYALGGK